MRSFNVVLRSLVLGLILWGVAHGAPAAETRRLLVEAEGFAQSGGWVVDSQFSDVMGSPFLLAHGLGKPVAPARTTVRFPQAGRYRLWVRTRDWVAEPQWAPGRFQIAVDGKPLPETFGVKGDGAWIWQDGGTVKVGAGDVTIELRDLTGFDGRCDALYFTTDASERPPDKADDAMLAWREGLLGVTQPPPDAGEFDVVVTGGGLAGCSAALTAARLGCRVALVQNRPVLGGNNSPEIGVHTGPWGIPGTLVTPEIAGDFDAKASNPQWWDKATGPMYEAERRRQAVVDGEKNVTQFLGWHVFRAQKEGGAIASVDARNITTNREQRFRAPIFIDCTGDGWVGYRAGADFRHGQEGRAEHNEPLAPEQPIKMTLGSTLQWYGADSGKPSSFPDVPWATAVSGGKAAVYGDWQWEYGHYRDTIWDAEEIRDHLLRAIYGAFATANQKNPKKYGTFELRQVNYIVGKRESRRLMGDTIMTQLDCWENLTKPDKVVQGGNPFDLHVPTAQHDFIIQVDKRVSLKERKLFDIPFRSLYSRNVPNLLMAGRCISATRIAHAAMRIQNTGGQGGVAVGAAAFLCRKYHTTPRGVYEQHLKELQDIVFARGEYAGALKPTQH